MNKTPKKKQSLPNPNNLAPHGLTEPLKEELLHFLEFHNAKRLTVNLRTLLLEFLMYDGSTEAPYLRDLLHDLHGLFDLLDAVEEKGGTEQQPLE